MIETRKCGVAAVATARARYVQDNVSECVCACGWVCGCVGVWVCGCVVVWVCGWVGGCSIATNNRLLLIRVVSFLVRSNWPPPDFRKRALYDMRYNILYHIYDPTSNFRMFLWIDNNIVKMVSNVHMGIKNEALNCPRKKPRINEFNRKHIQLV